MIDKPHALGASAISGGQCIMFMLLFVAALPSMPIISDHVDVIEINHLYAMDDGQLILDQIVFWRGKDCHAWRFANHARDKIRPEEARAFCRAWRAKNRCQPPAFVPDYTGPRPRRTGEYWVLVFHDNGALRRVTCNRWIETWTFVDPELEDRKRFKEHERHGLAKR